MRAYQSAVPNQPEIIMRRAIASDAFANVRTSPDAPLRFGSAMIPAAIVPRFIAAGISGIAISMKWTFAMSTPF